jgi:hypothetical protein
VIYPLGATSQSLDIQIVDDNGLPVTGLVAATFPTLTYSLSGPNADVAFPTLSDLTLITSPYVSGGVKERGNGVYRLDLPNGVFTTAGEVKVRGEATGKHVLAPWIDVAVTVANLTNAPTAGDFTAAMKTSLNAATPASVTGSVGSVSGSVGSVVAGVTVATNNDKTGYTLTVTPPTAAQIATAIFTDTTASDFTTSGSPGKILVAQLGGAFTTASSSIFTVAALANGPSGSGSSPASIATAVWQDLLASADFATVGSIGALLKSDIDATISSRLATTGYTAPDNAGVSSIVAKLPANAIADESLVINATNAIIAAVGTPMQSGVSVVLAAAQPNYAPAKAGSQMDLVGAPNTTAITAIQAGLSKPGTPQTVDGTVAIPTTGNVANSLNDCLNAARAQGFGKWARVGTALTLYAADGTTVVRTFVLDDATQPTSRT